MVTYIEEGNEMRNTIPAGTWHFRSQIGTYNFHYPAEEGERAAEDIEVVAEMAWPRMAGLAAYQITDGTVVWCEKGVVRAA
jgi:hypothetical protein